MSLPRHYPAQFKVACLLWANCATYYKEGIHISTLFNISFLHKGVIWWKEGNFHWCHISTRCWMHMVIHIWLHLISSHSREVKVWNVMHAKGGGKNDNWPSPFRDHPDWSQTYGPLPLVKMISDLHKPFSKTFYEPPGKHVSPWSFKVMTPWKFPTRTSLLHTINICFWQGTCDYSSRQHSLVGSSPLCFMPDCHQTASW